MNDTKYIRDYGYRYYVYLGPGNIKYFYTFDEAQIYATETGGKIGEVS